MSENGNRLPVVIGAVLAVVVVIGAVFWLTSRDDGATPSGSSASPTSSATSEAPEPSESGSPEPSARTAAVPVYFVGQTEVGPRLYREFQRQEVCGGASCVLEASVRSAVAGKAKDADYRVPWPRGTDVEAVSYDGDVLTIDLTGDDLHDRPAGMSRKEASLAVQQVLYSAQAALGKGRPPVQLLLDGSHTDQILGVPTAEPLAVADPDSVLASIWVYTPAEGDTVQRPFMVRGQAATFEANVVWELMRGDEVVRRGFSTARECCTLSPYSFTVKAPPGRYTLVVHDTDESDGEGVGTSQDTKNVTVR